MAIAYDSSSGALRTTLADLTFSHTCTGADRILFVGAWAGQSGSSPTITGATYNGVAMTELTPPPTPAGPTVLVQKLFYLVAPATGTNSIVISRGGSGVYTWGNAVSYTGASQTGVPDSQNTNTTTGTSLTTSTTTVADNSWLVGFMTAEGAPTLTAGAGTTVRDNQANWSAIFDSNGAKTPAGSYSLAMNAGSSKALAMHVASFKPAVAPTATPFSQVVIAM